MENTTFTGVADGEVIRAADARAQAGTPTTAVPAERRAPDHTEE